MGVRLCPLSLYLHKYQPFQADIRRVLYNSNHIFTIDNQGINRLSDTEKEIINWLVLNHHPVSFSQLRTQLSSSVSPQQLLEALESLEARSLIEKQSARLALQAMVREYAPYRLIGQKMTEVQQQVFADEELIPNPLCIPLFRLGR
ncbi:MAG TPA: hypothetical protein V6D11_07265 [Waterburya sp.]|jgi:DNA-binding HxlR family transcriptional regulator